MNTRETTLLCNSCGSAMTLSGDRTGGRAECTRCDQTVWFSSDGLVHQKVLPRLYPSPLPRRMYAEFVNHEREQRRFFATAQFELGMLSAEERDLKYESIDNAVDQFWAANPPPSPFWRRIREKLQGRKR